MSLLEATDLTKHFPVRRGVLGRQIGLVQAVDSISFTIIAVAIWAVMRFQRSPALIWIVTAAVCVALMYSIRAHAAWKRCSSA